MQLANHCITAKSLSWDRVSPSLTAPCAPMKKGRMCGPFVCGLLHRRLRCVADSTIEGSEKYMPRSGSGSVVAHTAKQTSRLICRGTSVDRQVAAVGNDPTQRRQRPTSCRISFDFRTEQVELHQTRREVWDFDFILRRSQDRLSLSSLVTTLCSPPRKIRLLRLENQRPLATTLFSRNSRWIEAAINKGRR